MRKIEKEMNRAIDGGFDWAKDNTQVITVGALTTHRSYLSGVYLHGHHIANVYSNMAGDRRVTPNVNTLSAWPTRTTMSRLRALGVDVCTRKGVVHLDGKPL